MQFVKIGDNLVNFDLVTSVFCGSSNDGKLFDVFIKFDHGNYIRSTEKQCFDDLKKYLKTLEVTQ